MAEKSKQILNDESAVTLAEVVSEAADRFGLENSDRNVLYMLAMRKSWKANKKLRTMLRHSMIALVAQIHQN